MFGIIFMICHGPVLSRVLCRPVPRPVIAGIANWFPDMISVAFDRKFDEKKDEMPPGVCGPHILQFFEYWEWED